jgi:tetratricopeptide (TPR) repeat protein
MNEDFNPGTVSENPPGDSGDRLASALEELIQGRRSGAGAPFPEPMGPKANPDHEKEGGPSETAGGPCPELGDWAVLLGEEQRPQEGASVDALLAHAAACRACAGRLRALSADLTPEESAALARLGCATAEVQRKMAVELARTPRQSGPRRAPPLYVWAGAGLAASLLIAVGITSYWRQSNNPERMLAEAYTNSRIFDLRMPGAGFAEVKPLTHLRGGSDSRESSSLRDAQGRIERHLEAAPGDAHWLQLEARSDILEEKFDPAIDILDRLVAAGPVTASLLLDDASAYFQRGAATGSENDRATALGSLRRADELAPGDTVVLFNEAVVMEDRGQLMNAVETWNRYLRLERDPRWLEEGRRRLQALEQKLNQLNSHQGHTEQGLPTPQTLRTLAAGSGARHLMVRNRVRAVGRGFIPGKRPIESAWDLQAAEKLNRAVGRGFIPGKKPIESAWASAPAVCSSGFRSFERLLPQPSP